MYIGVFCNNDGSSDNVISWKNHCMRFKQSLTTNLEPLGGDFNAPDWHSCFTTHECRNIDACGKLVDTFSKFDLTQMQTQPIREKLILDLYSTNKPDLVKTCKAILGISYDHAVVVEMSVRAQISKKPPRKVCLWSKAPWDDMPCETRSFAQSYQENSTQRNVHQNYECIEILIKPMLEQVSSKMMRWRVNLPWFTSNLKRQCKRKQHLYNHEKKGRYACTPPRV